jgi:hypothetical protein
MHLHPHTRCTLAGVLHAQPGAVLLKHNDDNSSSDNKLASAAPACHCTAHSGVNGLAAWVAALACPGPAHQVYTVAQIMRPHHQL